jgi:hypothetical protein
MHSDKKVSNPFPKSQKMTAKPWTKWCYRCKKREKNWQQEAKKAPILTCQTTNKAHRIQPITTKCINTWTRPKTWNDHKDTWPTIETTRNLVTRAVFQKRGRRKAAIKLQIATPETTSTKSHL